MRKFRKHKLGDLCIKIGSGATPRGVMLLTSRMVFL